MEFICLRGAVRIQRSNRMKSGQVVMNYSFNLFHTFIEFFAVRCLDIKPNLTESRITMHIESTINQAPEINATRNQNNLAGKHHCSYAVLILCPTQPINKILCSILWIYKNLSECTPYSILHMYVCRLQVMVDWGSQRPS